MTSVIRRAAVFALCLAFLPLSSPRAGDDLFNGTLWMQHSVERDALCRQAYSLALANLTRAMGEPSWCAMEAFVGELGGLPPAVIVDVDETVLDNHWYEARLVRDGNRYESKSWAKWCEEKAATVVPGALQFCQLADRLGVTVFYVTNRRESVAEPTIQNLRDLGFPVRDDGSNVMPRTDSSDKTARREAVAAEFRVLLLVGDAGGDFHEKLAGAVDLARRAAAGPFADRWGKSWIALPNPMYGGWARGELSFSPPDHSEPERVPVPGHPLLRSGPMAAWTDTTAAAVWLQMNAPATAQLRYWPEGKPKQARLTEAQSVDGDNDHIASFVLDGLAPGTTTLYELFLNGERALFSWPLAVRTPAIWQWRATEESKPHAPPNLSFLLGSCNYVNDASFDRPGKPYGAGFEIFESMAEMNADFMLWLGDNTYFREGDTSSEGAMRRRYAHTRALPEMQRLLATTHNIALWDDHDYGPDNSDRSFGLKGAANEIFTDYWPDRPRGTPSKTGTFLRMSYGDVDLFLLDDRTYRAPNNAPDSAAKVMLGPAQMRWLKDGLRTSRATFKLVVNGGQMLHPLPDHEDWARYPQEREEFLSFLASEDIEGVLFISGDRHQSELMLEARSGESPWYELTVSPLTAGPAGEKYKSTHDAQVEGSWVGERNFGLAKVTGNWGDRTLKLSLHDVDGQELWTRAFHQSELVADE
ncbi:MAG: alkaline phosphatase D [Pseudohongiellaceae bacterium]|jgi:alkaline phosphatase D